MSVGGLCDVGVSRLISLDVTFSKVPVMESCRGLKGHERPGLLARN